MTLDSLTITLTDTRLIDGWVAAGNANGLSPEALALEFLTTQGRSYAELNKVGVVTSGAFVQKFTPTEYGNILAAAQQVEVPEPILGDPTIDPDTGDEIPGAVTNQAEIDAAVAHNTAAEPVAALVQELTASPQVAMDDPRLAPGLDLLVQAGLLDASRPAEILTYVRPEPEVQE